MKNETIKNGLKVLLVAVIFSSCGEPAKEKQYVNSAKRIDVSWNDENGINDHEEFTVILIDSCEYLKSNYDRSRSVTHKGNCKFCTVRAKNNCQ
jgi:hypothetical protein